MSRFYVFTADHSGLPLALKMQNEGANVTLCLIPPEAGPEAKKKAEYLERNAEGLIRKLWADKALREIRRQRPGETYVIFDQIYGWRMADDLRRLGYRVLGACEVGFRLETDRKLALELFKKLGLDVPKQKSFGRGSARKVVQFLREAEELYVLKSDNPKIAVMVPKSSNDEVIAKLETEFDQINADGVTLQQKVEGVELAVETWYSNGEPVMAVVDLEMKRKYNEMSEVQTGCSANLVFKVDLSSDLRQLVNGPLDRFAAEYIGTGLFDLSVIYDQKEAKLWVLECCGSRFAYNCLYTTLLLLDWPVSDFFAAYLSGVLNRYGVERMFDQDRPYAGSVRVFNDDKTPDVPIYWCGAPYSEFYCWDCRRAKGGGVVTVGDESVGVLAAKGETPEAALGRVREAFDQLLVSTKWARDDFDKDWSPHHILRRFRELKRIGLV